MKKLKSSNNTKFLISAVLLLNLLNAQNYSVSNQVVVSGGVQQTGNAQYSTIITVGQPFIGTQEGGNYETSLGIWSLYLKEPDPPIVEASDGDYPDRIEVKFYQDVASPPVTIDFDIYREGSLFWEELSATTSSKQDMNVVPGYFYQYEAVATNDYGTSAKGSDYGFVNPNGTITGHIETPNGNPIANVDVSLSPNLGQSLSFDGSDDYINMGNPSSLQITGNQTIEMWLKPANFNDRMNPYNKTYFCEGAITQEPSGTFHYYFGNGSNYFCSTSKSGISLDTWSHLTVVRDLENMQMTWYIDGELVNQNPISAEFSQAAVSSDDLLIGDGYTRNYAGNIDEVRIWNVARTGAEIQRDKNRVLSGSEAGLVAYWKFDEGTGIQVFDKTGNEHDGTINGAGWSDEIPAVTTSVYTNVNGDYKMDGIYYGSGQTFTVTPQKQYHEFQPASRQVTLNNSNTSSDGIDFTDIAMIAVSGFVKFESTSCYAEDVEILVDGESSLPPTYTDENGEFVIDFEPNTSHKIQPIWDNHIFIDAYYEFFNITMTIADIVFKDTKTYTLSGVIGGGDCHLPIGDCEITVRSQNGCLTVRDTVNLNYSISGLPPMDYNVSVFNLENPQIRFQAVEVSLKEGSQSLDFIYRAPLEIRIVDLPLNACDLTVLPQYVPVEIGFKVFEQYGEDSCLVDSGVLAIYDNISDRDPQAIPFTGGQARYTLIPGLPNVLGGGDHPYSKMIQVVATDNAERNASTDAYAIVTGLKPQNNQHFATTMPEMPLFVLRDPPGDNSYSYLSEDQTICENIEIYLESSHSLTGYQKVSLGADFEFETGFFFSVSTNIDVTLDFTHESEVRKSQSDTYSNTFCFSSSETFTTSDGEAFIGDQGDVYVGGALNLIYGVADSVGVSNDCDVDVDQKIIMNIEGFETTYIYSERYIKEELIPSLHFIGEDSSAARWESFVALNDSARSAALHNRNISFDAGATYEFSETTDSTFSHAQEFMVEIDHSYAGDFGITVNGLGFVGGFAHIYGDVNDTTTTHDTTRTRTVGYVLADDDPGDNFSVDVLRDQMWGMPAFKVVGGESSCPWEDNTVPRQGAYLTMDKYVASDIMPGEMAVFTLNLGNVSQTGESWIYELSMLNETNPRGAIIRCNGAPLTGAVEFELDSGEVSIATITVERGPEAYDYEGLTLRLATACEIELANALGEVPNLADFASFDVHFVRPCSPISIAEPGGEWFFNSTNEDTFEIILNEYDLDDGYLQKLVLEYSPIGEDNWIIAKTVNIDTVEQDWIKLKWIVSHLPDAEYKIRAKSECALISGYSEVLNGVIDRVAPEIYGTPAPMDGVLGPDDVIEIVFTELINNYIPPENIILTDITTGAQVDIEHSIDENKIKITPDVINKYIENHMLKVTLSSIMDLYGNIIAEPIEWEFTVNRNPVRWYSGFHDQVKYTDMPSEFSMQLFNDGGQIEPFVVEGLPNWLNASPASGDIPANSFVVVNFYVNDYVNIGDYNETFYAVTTMGNEPLSIDLRVLCPPPDWIVNPSDFQYSINMVAELNVQDELSSDKFDLVGAFVGNECRGVAGITKVDVLDTYLVFLTTYSNQFSGDDLEFRVWDASGCSEFARIQETYEFTSNTQYGEPLNPVSFTATEDIFQHLSFPAGWRWFSMNVAPDDPSLNTLLGGLTAETGDIIKSQENYSQMVSNVGWIGSLGELNNTGMFQININEPGNISLIGPPVDFEDTQIPVASGWNWIAYLLQRNVPVNMALQSLHSSSNDLLKDQREFAMYVEEAGWIGTLSHMVSGDGYMLRSANKDTLLYANVPETGAKVLAKANYFKKETVWPQDAPDWNVVPSNYQYNMSITGVVVADGIEADTTIDIVAAFVDNECRGVVQPIYVPELNRCLYFLPVFSNSAEGELVSFQYYDATMDNIRAIRETNIFKADSVCGNPLTPYVWTTHPLGIWDNGYIPDTYSLGQNFPNPFNPITRIGYGLPRDDRVKIVIYNILGQEVKQLVSENQSAGYRFVLWNGLDNHGNQVSTGIYIYTMSAGSFNNAKKMVILK